MTKSGKKRKKILWTFLLAAAALGLVFFLIRMEETFSKKAPVRTKPIQGTGCFAAKDQRGYFLRLSNGEIHGVSLAVDPPPDHSLIDFDGTLLLEDEILCRGTLPTIYLTRWALVQPHCAFSFDQASRTPSRPKGVAAAGQTP